MTVPTSQVQCARCGQPIAADSQFCEHCGVELARFPPAGPQPPAHHGPDTDDTRPLAPSHRPTPYFSSSMNSGSADRLLGAPSPNETYLGNRLMYSDVGTSFDPLANPTYQRALISQFLATMFAWVLGSIALFILFALPVLIGTIDSVSSRLSDPFGLGESGESSTPSTVSSLLAVVWNILQLALSVLLACLFWLRRIPVQLTEWLITVDARGGAARAALDHMYTIIAARRTPIRGLQVVRLNAPRQPPRDYLRIDDDYFTGFVSAFEFGSDLFIGWTFWLNLSPARWLWLSLGRMFRGRGLGIYGSVVYDSPKALREVMHSAVRQGVDMATGETEPMGQGTIGNTVPIVGVDL